MTIKYMWIAGMWDEELCALKNVLHVPVDNYILGAIWDSNKNSRVKIPLRPNRKRTGKFSPDKIIAWSKWNCEDYRCFQKTLRNHLCKAPIEWEGAEWLNTAQSNNQIHSGS